MSEQSAAAVRERPILFSGPMVRAILDGRKTQTRRVVRNEFGACDLCMASAVPHPHGDGGLGVFGSAPYLRVSACDDGAHSGGRTRCPYGEVGDVLWVRETLQRYNREPATMQYAATMTAVPGHASAGSHPNGAALWPWGERKSRPSIFMPRWASRLSLRITEVRVERLQEITEADALAEGITWDPGPLTGPARSEFAAKWDTINGKRAPWSGNPWVWVITFERIAPTPSRHAEAGQ